MKILVVDDEKLLCKGLKFNLEREGYEVDCANDGFDAMEVFGKENYDLVLLDVMMPGMDGFEVCAAIREKSTVPIIMLTAKGDDTDKLLGFDYGVDDYITKPFNILEVKARVRALLRRASAAALSETAPETGSFISAGDIKIDTEGRAVYKNSAEVDLTLKEYDLLLFLAENRGRVYSRENLLDLVWGDSFQGDIRTVDVHMRRLREKLETDPARPEYLLTKWGVGYYMAKI